MVKTDINPFLIIFESNCTNLENRMETVSDSVDCVFRRAELIYPYCTRISVTWWLFCEADGLLLACSSSAEMWKRRWNSVAAVSMRSACDSVLMLRLGQDIILL